MQYLQPPASEAMRAWSAAYFLCKYSIEILIFCFVSGACSAASLLYHYSINRLLLKYNSDACLLYDYSIDT